LYAVDKNLESWRIAVGVIAGRLNFAFVAEILVSINRGSHLAQVIAKVVLACTPYLVPCHGDGHGTEDQQDRESDDQLNQCESSLTLTPPLQAGKSVTAQHVLLLLF
jgi:hypothetical protein